MLAILAAAKGCAMRALTTEAVVPAPARTPAASVVPGSGRREGWVNGAGTFVHPAANQGARMTATTSPVHELVWQRMALGKSAREAAPRSSYAKWRPAADRPDPVALIEG